MGFKILPLLVLVILIAAVGLYTSKLGKSRNGEQKFLTPSEIANFYKSTASPSPTPTSTPTPKPLTFAEMNALYGPCVNLPTLMYHHIQSLDLAKTKNQQNLTVDTAIFIKQMQYLKDKGYQTPSMNDLISFFDYGVMIPKKSVLLTFDDGYDDFATNAVPVLRQFGFRATLFTPTGLMDNPGYLSWDTVRQIATAGDIEFANHTWSHKSMRADGSIDEKEIVTADTQLAEKGLDNPKVFAYPYGTVADIAEKLLAKYGYKLAFTTRPGSVLCQRQRLELPRIRIGNTSLQFYRF